VFSKEFFTEIVTFLCVAMLTLSSIAKKASDETEKSADAAVGATVKTAGAVPRGARWQARYFGELYT